MSNVDTSLEALVRAEIQRNGRRPRRLRPARLRGHAAHHSAAGAQRRGKAAAVTPSAPVPAGAPPHDIAMLAGGAVSRRRSLTAARGPGAPL